MATQAYDTLAAGDRSAARALTKTPRSVVIGRVMSTLGVAALALDGAMKLMMPQLMIDNSPPLGLPNDTGFYRMIGAILLVSVGLHVTPRTKLLGAILVTAFLGGAVAANVRVGMPLLTNTLFGVYVGLLIWGGLYLRSPSLRAALSGER